MNQLSTKTGKTAHLVLTIVSVVILTAIGFYMAGYRVGNFGIAKAQSVQIQGLPEETEIFLDNKSIGFKEGDVNLLLAPGLHSIILSKAGFWPYIENIELLKEIPVTTAINPFFFLQNPSGILIGSNDPEYQKIISLFNDKRLPTADAPINSNGIQLYIEKGKIIAKLIGNLSAEGPTGKRYFFDQDSDTKEIFNPITEVRSIAFYKDRNDVMIVAMQDGIFAIEMNPIGTQNLQPLYEGKEPDFRIGTDGKLYAKDENTLMLLSI